MPFIRELLAKLDSFHKLEFRRIRCGLFVSDVVASEYFRLQHGILVNCLLELWNCSLGKVYISLHLITSFDN